MRRKAKLRMLREAEAEYEEAVRRYARHSPRTATRFQEAIRKACAAIEKTPNSWPHVDEDDHRQLILLKFPYAIIYRIEEPEIVIVAIAHTSREEGYWMGREI